MSTPGIMVKVVIMSELVASNIQLICDQPCYPFKDSGLVTCVCVSLVDLLWGVSLSQCAREATACYCSHTKVHAVLT